MSVVTIADDHEYVMAVRKGEALEIHDGEIECFTWGGTPAMARELAYALQQAALDSEEEFE